MEIRNYNFAMGMDFDIWLTEQAKINKRSKSAQMRFILEQAMISALKEGAPEL